MESINGQMDIGPYWMVGYWFTYGVPEDIPRGWLDVNSDWTVDNWYKITNPVHEDIPRAILHAGWLVDDVMCCGGVDAEQ